MPGLFTLNERAVLSGSWEHGFFSFSAVGAYNVGSIKLEVDKVYIMFLAFLLGMCWRRTMSTFCWAEKYFSLSACDASKKSKNHRGLEVWSNVLPILISQELRTNEKGRFRMGQFTEKQLGANETGLPLRRGDKVGYFILGSSIVLLFEAPKNFKFLVEPGQRVQFGQPLGKVHW